MVGMKNRDFFGTRKSYQESRKGKNDKKPESENSLESGLRKAKEGKSKTQPKLSWVFCFIVDDSEKWSFYLSKGEYVPLLRPFIVNTLKGLR